MAGTLGGLIKDFRLQKKLSQLEVAAAIGWKEGSILSRIEQGIVNKPSKEVIEKLAIILELSNRERNELLLAGNYLPDKGEIDKIRREINTLMNDWKYPATAYDFSWRIIHENKICKYIYYENDSEAEKIEQNVPNVFELNFSEDYAQNKYAHDKPGNGIEKELIQSLTQYRTEQKSHNAEENVNNLIKKLILNKTFRTIWEKTQNVDHEKMIDNYTFADYVIPARGKKETLSFHLFNAPLLDDPRINIEFHIPADQKTFEYFENGKFDI
jgi:transcriptional regulator with XRE-family HTH domain